MATKAERFLVARNRAVRTRANGMRHGVNRWLSEYAELWVQAATGALRNDGIKGLERLADSEPKIQKNLKGGDFVKLLADISSLFRRYGLRQMQAAGEGAARAAGGKWAIPPKLAADWNEKLENKVVLLVDSTESQVRQSIKDLVSEALKESPRPTARTLARRIARQWHGPAQRTPRGPEAWPGRGTDAERRETADWARTQEQLQDGGKENIFSFGRAGNIARTELAQAEGAAIANSYAEVGVDSVEWLAHPYNPGHDRPGSRNHYMMNGKIITVEAMTGRDKSKWFRLPSGIFTPYPNWIGLPAGETINCACTIVPARTRKAA